jgi:hypothetical protein
MKQSILDLCTAGDINDSGLKDLGITKLRQFADAEAMEAFPNAYFISGARHSVDSWQRFIALQSAYLRQQSGVVLGAIRDFFDGEEGREHRNALRALKLHVASEEQKRREAKRAEEALVRKLAGFDVTVAAREVESLAFALLRDVEADDCDKDRLATGLAAIRDLATEIVEETQYKKRKA